MLTKFPEIIDLFIAKGVPQAIYAQFLNSYDFQAVKNLSAQIMLKMSQLATDHQIKALV